MDALATGSGVAAMLTAVGYATKQFVDARKESRAERKNPSGAITDAATANSILLTALKDERDEGQRREAVIDALRKENSDLYDQMRQQRQEYEAEIDALRKDLAGLTDRLDELRTRIKYGSLPDGPG